MFNKFSIFNFQFSIIIIALSAIMIACSSDDSDDPVDPVIPAQRTVIAYFDGNNDLSSSLKGDIAEMETGSKNLSSTTNLIVFANIVGQKPYIAEMVNGKSTKVREWDNTFLATHPDSMLSVMQWIIDKYPANDYGIIFGGHGTGSLVKSDTIPTTLHPAYAYGWDRSSTTVSGRCWINATTLANVISHLSSRMSYNLKFIFFDCCLMQDYDVACQLNKYARYLIAPVSETPSAGAPYHNIVPILSIDNTEHLCDTLLTIYQTYCEQTALPICISAIRTRDVDDMQIKANAALSEVKSNLPQPYDYSNVIYYHKEQNVTNPLLWDLKSFLYEQNKKGYLSDATYNAFVEAQKKCIFTSRKSSKWKSGSISDYDFTTFSVTDDNYGALSITRKAIEE